MRERLFLLGCLAVCLAGLLRDVSVHFWKEGFPRPAPRVDERYRAVAPLAPERLGFVSDLPVGSEAGGRRYFEALYALSPRVIVPGGAERAVLLDAPAPFADAFCAAHGLRVLAREGGVTLAERK
jgi:hypothetical protein